MSGMLYQPDHGIILNEDPSTNPLVPFNWPGDTVPMATGLCGEIEITMACLGRGGKTVYRKTSFQIMAKDSATLYSGIQALTQHYDGLSIGEPVKTTMKITHFVQGDSLKQEPETNRDCYVAYRNAVSNRVRTDGILRFLKDGLTAAGVRASLKAALEATGAVFCLIKQSDDKRDYVQYPCNVEHKAWFLDREALTDGEVTPINPGDDTGIDD